MTITLPRLRVLPAPFRTLEEGVSSVPSAAPCSLKTVDGREPHRSRRTQFWCFQDEKSFYVVFSAAGSRAIEEPALIGPARTVRTAGLWEMSEVVEVFVGADARTTGHYREFEVAPDGRWIALDVQTDAAGVNGNEHWATHFRCAVAWQGGLWKAALEIPWHDLGGPGWAWHGNFFRSIPGNGGEGLFAWSPTGARCFHRPERFGELML